MFPSFLNGAQFGAFDCTVCETLSKISKVAFNGSAWMQATLPVKQGYLGLRRAIDSILHGFISSLMVDHLLVDAVLSCVIGLVQMWELTPAVLSWSSAHVGVCKPQGVSWLHQNAWDIEVSSVFCQPVEQCGSDQESQYFGCSH